MTTDRHTYEYSTQPLNAYPGPVTLVDEMADDGWRLCETIEGVQGSTQYLVFERPVAQSDENTETISE